MVGTSIMSFLIATVLLILFGVKLTLRSGQHLWIILTWRSSTTAKLPTGFPVKLKLTSKLAGKNGVPRAITIEKTVEDLSDSPLSPSLFELPKGFHENLKLWQGHSSSPR